jgi:hypothetical protein
MIGKWPAVALAGALALALQLPPAARAAETLTVCLDEDIPLYSVHEKNESGGFVVSLSEAIARRLDRGLKIQWFETKLDADDSTVLGANALLSDGRCELVGGYPLVRDALGKPGMETARMPDFDGAKPEDRRRRVALGTLLPTRAYHYAPITLLLGPAARKPAASLADLEGVKLGIEAASLSDAILMLYKNGLLVDQIAHFVPGRSDLLPRLERGEFEATLIDLRRFDAYRAQHPDTGIRPTGFYYRIGFNMGFVGLSTKAALIERVNKVIEDMLAEGEVAPLAEAAGLTYLPPHQPEVLEHLTLRDLREE